MILYYKVGSDNNTKSCFDVVLSHSIMTDTANLNFMTNEKAKVNNQLVLSYLWCGKNQLSSVICFRASLNNDVSTEAQSWIGSVGYSGALCGTISSILLAKYVVAR